MLHPMDTCPLQKQFCPSFLFFCVFFHHKLTEKQIWLLLLQAFPPHPAEKPKLTVFVSVPAANSTTKVASSPLFSDFLLDGTVMVLVPLVSLPANNSVPSG